MFCVIQKIQNKKQDPYGEHKELISSETTLEIPGQPKRVIYGYSYGTERFERPILDAYKISIHHSYREEGKVKKKQWVICTMSHYTLLEFGVEDCTNSTRLNKQAEEMGIPVGQLLGMVYDKLNPLVDQLIAAHEQTEEYKTKQKHDAILKAYHEAKQEFEAIYGSDTYKYCYDVFGELRDPEYLAELKATKAANDEYARKSREESQKRFNDYYNSGGDSGGGSSYYTSSSGNYTDDEKAILKEIYRMASKKYHPDISKDDGSKMKLLTALKDKWGI